jgi:hypothetical protein
VGSFPGLLYIFLRVSVKVPTETKNTAIVGHNPKLSGARHSTPSGISSGTVKRDCRAHCDTMIGGAYRVTFLCGFFTNFLETVRPVQPSKGKFRGYQKLV